MLRLRKEIQDYSRSCEHLISAASDPNTTPFTANEIELIAYYASEMTNLVGRLLRRPEVQEYQKRPTVREYARACEALLLLKELSAEEQQTIRHSIRDVTAEILHGRQNPGSDSGQTGTSSTGGI